jgi:hypothetical protein
MAMDFEDLASFQKEKGRGRRDAGEEIVYQCLRHYPEADNPNAAVWIHGRQKRVYLPLPASMPPMRLIG